MSILDSLKRFKPGTWIYNFFHRRKLSHNRDAYRQYGLNRSLFQSISSKDFPDKISKAWLDQGHSRELLRNDARVQNYPAAVREQLLAWSDEGYLIWPGFLDEIQVDAMNGEVERIAATGKKQLTHDNKLPFLNRESALISNLTQDTRLMGILELILGRPVVPFQTLNFIKGSGQRAHSDSIHMTTYPLGYLIAVWIALEDIRENSGPLFYYPGSHKLPYLLNDDFGNISTGWMLGNREYSDYEDVIGDLIQKKQMKPLQFLPRKGDMLIWHANLLHGGEPIRDHALTRKSMVIHYFARDVIKYHEITERPSLIPEYPILQPQQDQNQT